MFYCTRNCNSHYTYTVLVAGGYRLGTQHVHVNAILTFFRVVGILIKKVLRITVELESTSLLFSLGNRVLFLDKICAFTFILYIIMYMCMYSIIASSPDYSSYMYMYIAGLRNGGYYTYMYIHVYVYTVYDPMSTLPQ